MVATQIFFMFTPKIGKDSHFDEHIFQRGWFNHQPDMESEELGFIQICDKSGELMQIDSTWHDDFPSSTPS